MKETKIEQGGEKDRVQMPMYYEQIHKLMGQLSDFQITDRPISHFRTLRALYSLVRPEVNKDKKQYFDNKIKQIKDCYPSLPTRGHFGDGKSIKVGQLSFELEIELNQTMAEVGITKILKRDPNKMEVY